MRNWIIGFAVLVGLIAIGATVNDCRVLKAVPGAVEKYITEHASSLKGDNGDKGDTGEPGKPGADGINGTPCWDLNDDGIPDIASEDTNKDGKVDVLDCRGADGKDGAVVKPAEGEGEGEGEGAGGAPAVVKPAPKPVKVKPVAQELQPVQGMPQVVIDSRVFVNGTELPGAGGQGGNLHQITTGNISGGNNFFFPQDINGR